MTQALLEQGQSLLPDVCIIPGNGVDRRVRATLELTDPL